MSLGPATKCIDCGKPISDADLELNESGLWCRQHEMERRERITQSMTEITKSFEKETDDPA